MGPAGRSKGRNNRRSHGSRDGHDPFLRSGKGPAASAVETRGTSRPITHTRVQTIMFGSSFLFLSNEMRASRTAFHRLRPRSRKAPGEEKMICHVGLWQILLQKSAIGWARQLERFI